MDVSTGIKHLFWNAGESRLRALFRVPVVFVLVLLAALAVGTGLLAWWLRRTGDGLAIQERVAIPDLWSQGRDDT